MLSRKSEPVPKVLTTGQVARLCNVAPRTVSKWFDMGQLRGYRIPGSRDRRIPLDQLLRFMKAHSMPLNGLDAGPRRVMLVKLDVEMAQIIRQRLEQSGFQVQVAQSAFEAGLMAERLHPHVLVLDRSADEDGAASIAAAVRRDRRRGPGDPQARLRRPAEQAVPHLSTGHDIDRAAELSWPTRN